MRVGRASVLVAALALAGIPSAALAQEDCPGMEDDPLGTLDDCVTHHWNAGAGEILSPGIYQSLLSLVLEAQAANARGDVDAAVRILQAFISEVEALSGKLIVGHAENLADHADRAIKQIEPS